MPRCLTSPAAFFARMIILDHRVHNSIGLIWLSQFGALHAEAATPPLRISVPVVIWHKCSVHFCSPTIAARAASSSQHRGQKRPAAVSSEASARTLRRLEPNTPSRACLGPRLAARFPHLVNGAERQQHTSTTPRIGPGSDQLQGPRAP